MIWACRGASAMPFIRVPDATESDIQKATDIGALESSCPPWTPWRRLKRP